MSNASQPEAAFFDASCSRCGASIGWSGRVADRPSCRRCGYRPPQDSLDADQAKIDEYRRLETELRDANTGWELLREARVAAGLTLRQAAKLLGIHAVSLSEVEGGRVTPKPELLERMKRCYSGDDISEARIP